MRITGVLIGENERMHDGIVSNAANITAYVAIAPREYDMQNGVVCRRINKVRAEIILYWRFI
jgi:hypothetical protein